jgi:hypothetical protein
MPKSLIAVTMRHPANNPVAEAQDGRIRKGTHTGDPLKPEKKR